MPQEQLQQEIDILKNRVMELEQIIFDLISPSRIKIEKDINIPSPTGIRIGLGTAQKIGFYGVTPVVQGAAITAPSGGGTVDAEARTAINTIRTRLTSIGITA